MALYGPEKAVLMLLSLDENVATPIIADLAPSELRKLREVAANMSSVPTDALDNVYTPTLLVVGGAEGGVIELNEQALARLRGPKALAIVPGASHLFPEPGALEAVIEHAASWFARHLKSTSTDRTRTASVGE